MHSTKAQSLLGKKPTLIITGIIAFLLGTVLIIEYTIDIDDWWNKRKLARTLSKNADISNSNTISKEEIVYITRERNFQKILVVPYEWRRIYFEPGRMWTLKPTHGIDLEIKWKEYDVPRRINMALKPHENPENRKEIIDGVEGPQWIISVRKPTEVLLWVK